MIKIISVEIDGFINPSQKIKLDFIESNIICIYGNNGSGKTSFLEILFAVFDRDEDILELHNVNRVNIKYIIDSPEIKKQINELKEELSKCDNGDEINRLKDQLFQLGKLANNTQTVSIGIDINEEGKKYYNFESLDSSDFSNISSLFLGIGRGIHKKELNIPRTTLWHFFRSHKKISEDKILTGNEIDSISEKLANYLMPKNKSDISRREDEKVETFIEKKNIYFPNIEIDTIEQLVVNKYQKSIVEADKKINQALSQITMSLFDNSLSEEVNIDNDLLRDRLLYNKSLILEVLKNNERYKLEFKKKIFVTLDKLEEDKGYLSTIDDVNRAILFNIVKKLENEVEIFKEIQLFVNEYNSFLNYDKELVINGNGVFIAPENHSLQKLSSGERHLLTFFATILLLGKEQNFILLDEPEISLDIEWQEKLLSTISKLAPNSQIIVASHSPSIMGDYFKSVVGIEPEVKSNEQ